MWQATDCYILLDMIRRQIVLLNDGTFLMLACFCLYLSWRVIEARGSMEEFNLSTVAVLE